MQTLYNYVLDLCGILLNRLPCVFHYKQQGSDTHGTVLVHIYQYDSFRLYSCLPIQRLCAHSPVVEDETPVDGVLSYRLEGIEPDANTAVGASATREVTVARKVTDQDLRGVSTIRVEGVRNARVARR